MRVLGIVSDFVAQQVISYIFGTKKQAHADAKSAGTMSVEELKQEGCFQCPLALLPLTRPAEYDLQCSMIEEIAWQVPNQAAIIPVQPCPQECLVLPGVEEQSVSGTFLVRRCRAHVAQNGSIIGEDDHIG
jgi:hypothetical protein